MTDSSTTALIKGVKYQSYRAVRDLILRCANNENATIYVAIERFDDVAIFDESSVGLNVGQAKNHSKDFNINSSDIKKTIKNFFTIYDRFPDDSNLSFFFYTPVGYCIEKTSSIIMKEEIEILEKDDTCFLEVLSKKREEKYPKLINRVVSRIIGPADDIFKYSDHIMDFIGKITWDFTDDDLDSIRNCAIKKIKDLKYFNHTYEGKEEIIFDCLVEEIERKSLESSSISFFLSGKDVENIFLKLTINDYKPYDNASAEFSILDITDTRNLEKKILDVCSIDDKRFFDLLNKKITRGKSDHMKITDEDSKTLQYRVYEVCDEKLYDLINDDFVFTRESISTIFDDLFNESKKLLEDRGRDFRYALRSDDCIKNTILILFNECYLDFIAMEDR